MHILEVLCAHINEVSTIKAVTGPAILKTLMPTMLMLMTTMTHDKQSMIAQLHCHDAK